MRILGMLYETEPLEKIYISPPNQNTKQRIEQELKTNMTWWCLLMFFRKSFGWVRSLLRWFPNHLPNPLLDKNVTKKNATVIHWSNNSTETFRDLQMCCPKSHILDQDLGNKKSTKTHIERGWVDIISSCLSWFLGNLLWNSTFEATEKKKRAFFFGSKGDGTFPPASEGSLPVRRWKEVQSVQLQASKKKDGGEKNGSIYTSQKVIDGNTSNSIMICAILGGISWSTIFMRSEQIWIQQSARIIPVSVGSPPTSKPWSSAIWKRSKNGRSLRPTYCPPEKKNGRTFHKNGCLVRILIMVHYNPHITG